MGKVEYFMILFLLFLIGGNLFAVYAMYHRTLDHKRDMVYAKSIRMPDSYWLQQEYRTMYHSDLFGMSMLFWYEIPIVCVMLRSRKLEETTK